MAKRLDNLNHFLLNSDFPMDKVVWMFEGESNTSQYSSTTIRNNLPYKNYPIFAKGMATIDNWQTAFPLGASRPLSDKPYDSTSLSYIVNNDDHYIYLSWFINSTSNATIKYRLWAVAREDYDLGNDYGKTSSYNYSKTHLKFDSTKNYPRLIKDGIAKSGDTITHGLGYTPHVDFWWTATNDNFNYGWNYTPSGRLGSQSSTTPATIQATDQTITFKQNYGSDIYYYYRIYA